MHDAIARSALTVAVALSVACATNPSADPEITPASSRAASSTSSTAARLGIPPGHLPPPGSCRVWVQGVPPGHQSKPGPCASLLRTGPPGSWLIYRPTNDRKVVHVREIDPQRAGVVVRTRVYDVATGRVERED